VNAMNKPPVTGAEPFPVGKLPAELLRDLLRRYAGHDERLVVGPQVGEDAAVLDMGERYLAVKSDPITFATDEIGWYVVHVNANDLATMGATPRWLLLTLLLPERRTGERLVEGIFAQVSQACTSLGIVLCGGHTEITFGLDRPVAVGMLLGEVEKDELVRTSGAQVGDELILTKGIAIEGTALLAREKSDWLTQRLGAELVSQARGLLHVPGISVVRDSQVARRAGRIHAMHDPTEGGLATGLWEMAMASGRGVVVDVARVHHFPETVAVCRALGLDPLGLIASGALLLAASSADSEAIVGALRQAGIDAAVIGRVQEGPARVEIETAGGLTPLPTFDRDEMARLFEVEEA
jgi:hydrogenase expression/formation protein HypE